MKEELEIVLPFDTSKMGLPAEPTEEEKLLQEVSKVIEHADRYKDVFNVAITLFNYKQRRQYQLSKLEFLFIPVFKDKMIKVTLLARGGHIASDTKLMEAVVYSGKNWACAKVDYMVANVMRYGLKQLFLQGEKVSDDAFL